MSTYSERIKEVLYKKGLNIKEFSLKIGMKSPNTIQLIIRENRKPSFKTVNKIMTAFPEINYEWLMQGEIKQNSNLPESMSNNDDLTVTAKQVISQLDINNKHYTAILDQKMKDDRDYYDNDSNHVKNIASILEGFKSLEKKIESHAIAAAEKVVTNLLTQANGLEKKFDTLEEKMDANATRRAAGVSRVIGEKMDTSNEYWIKRAEEKDAYWHKENLAQKDLFLTALDKVLIIEQDLENIKSFMAVGFENEAIKKADKKTAKKLAKKLSTKKLEKN